jgi:hypothetical protein
MKKIIEKMNGGLRKKCDAMPPERRRVVVICSLVIFAVLAIISAVDGLFLQNNRSRLPEVEHIKLLNLPKPSDESMNTLNLNSHDDDE